MARSQAESLAPAARPAEVSAWELDRDAWNLPRASRAIVRADHAGNDPAERGKRSPASAARPIEEAG